MFKLAAIFDYAVDQTFGPEKYCGATASIPPSPGSAVPHKYTIYRISLSSITFGSDVSSELHLSMWNILNRKRISKMNEELIENEVCTRKYIRLRFCTHWATKELINFKSSKGGLRGGRGLT